MDASARRLALGLCGGFLIMIGAMMMGMYSSMFWQAEFIFGLFVTLIGMIVLYIALVTQVSAINGDRDTTCQVRGENQNIQRTPSQGRRENHQTQPSGMHGCRTHSTEVSAINGDRDTTGQVREENQNTQRGPSQRRREHHQTERSDMCCRGTHCTEVSESSEDDITGQMRGENQNTQRGPSQRRREHHQTERSRMSGRGTHNTELEQGMWLIGKEVIKGVIGLGVQWLISRGGLSVEVSILGRSVGRLVR